MTGFPRTTGALRQALAAAGIHPKRRHGQNFLTDANAVDAIVRDAGVRPGDPVVEVGTGPGLLTHALCEAGARIVTFDVDPEIQALARSLRAWPERVRFECLDVLQGKSRLAPRFVEALEVAPAQGRPRLVSNLPYSAATPIILGVLSLPEPPDRLVVMVQAEVGAKLLATVGTSDYGVPSVAVGLKAQGRILRRFGPEVFWPRPKVRSVLLELVPVLPCPVQPGEHIPFGAFVTAVFTRRRKVMATALRVARPGLERAEACSALQSVGIDERARPEAVSPGSFLALWRSLGGGGTGSV